MGHKVDMCELHHCHCKMNRFQKLRSKAYPCIDNMQWAVTASWAIITTSTVTVKFIMVKLDSTQLKIKIHFLGHTESPSRFS